MKKSAIFISSFMVSFMVIYSVYYYMNVKDLDRGVVSAASDLKNTVIGYEGLNTENKSVVYNLGLFQSVQQHALTANDTSHWLADAKANPIPQNHFLGIDTPYSRNALEKIYEHLLIKFSKHPPIDFGKLKNGDSIMFSYFFQNISLPVGFRRAAAGIKIKDKDYYSLEYYPFDSLHNSASVCFFTNTAGDKYLLQVENKESGELATWVSNAEGLGAMSNYINAGRMLKEGTITKHTFGKSESVVIPELDFSFVKRYKQDDLAAFGALFQRYKVIEERMKFKLSYPEGQNKRIEHASGFKSYNFNGNTLFYLKKKGAEKPYFMVLLNDPEILVPVKH